MPSRHRKFAIAAITTLAAPFYLGFAVVSLAQLVEWCFAIEGEGRLFPFKNAHLLEEAMEGKYSPLTDGALLTYAGLLAVLVFFAWGLVGGRVYKSGFVRYYPYLISLAIAAVVLLRVGFTPGIPFVFSFTAMFLLLLFFGAGALGVIVGRKICQSCDG